MTIQLSPEQEQLIGRAIGAGLISAPTEAIELGIAAILAHLQSKRDSETIGGSEEWSEKLSEWAGSHSSTAPPLPDEAFDRESIYGSRGI